MICALCQREIPRKVVERRAYVHSTHTGKNYCPATDRRCESTYRRNLKRQGAAT